jgi:hypothetical protein
VTQPTPTTSYRNRGEGQEALTFSEPTEVVKAPYLAEPDAAWNSARFAHCLHGPDHHDSIARVERALQCEVAADGPKPVAPEAKQAVASLPLRSHDFCEAADEVQLDVVADMPDGRIEVASIPCLKTARTTSMFSCDIARPVSRPPRMRDKRRCAPSRFGSTPQ